MTDKSEKAQAFADRFKKNTKGAMKDNNIKTRGEGSGMRKKGFGTKS